MLVAQTPIKSACFRFSRTTHTAVICVLSLLLAAVLGFAAHRASLCSVRAVEEMLTSRSARVLGSFAKTALWAMAVSIPIVWLWPDRTVPVQGYGLSPSAFAGGFLFGVGAALNGGCTFSTLGYLADGCLWMLATLIGMCAGFAGWRYAADAMLIPTMQPLVLSTSMTGSSIGLLWSLLWVWAVWELWRLWRSRTPKLNWRERVCAERYSLAAAALVLGTASGILCTLHGSWTYTTVFKREVEALMLSNAGPPALLLWLFLAVFAGMAISSWTRGSFRLRWRGGWLRRLLGGLLMGMGGAVIPGGNDELILRAIPALSPHALPAYLALLAGIACALLVLRIARKPRRSIGAGV